MAVNFDARTGRANFSEPASLPHLSQGSKYDVSTDGRFLINSHPSDASPLTLLTNWTAALKR
jgi:hypothetical protein